MRPPTARMVSQPLYAGPALGHGDSAAPQRQEREDPEEGALPHAVKAVGSFVAYTVTPGSIVIGCGALVTFLLVVIPSWNAIGLLRDPVFMYMTDSQTPGWMLTCCVLLFVASYISLQMVFRQVRPEMRTEYAIMMVGGIFLLALGILLILFGGPIDRQATRANTELMSNCKLGPRSEQLYIASKELESLRATPSCAKQASIEECVGFSAYTKLEEAAVLKAMETNYECSGMCQDTDAKGEQIYPPTLFSKADNKLSCDGMAARRMSNFASEVARETLYQGCILVVMAIFISFKQLLAICSSSQKLVSKSGKSYGATL